MATKTLYEFEKCEAAKKDGTRCQAEGIESVFNPGAPFPFSVCGTHKRSAEAHIRKDGAIPRNWGRYNF